MKPVVGHCLKDNKNAVIAKVHEWDAYYDLDVFNKDTGVRGHVRILKGE